MSDSRSTSFAVGVVATVVAPLLLAPRWAGAQAPAGDACPVATPVALAPGQTSAARYHNRDATDDGFASPLNCLSDAGAGAAAELGDVWFRVESAEETLEVTVEADDAGGDPLPAPQFLVLESAGACAGYALLACATDVGGGTARAVLTGLNPGRVRYVLVSGADGGRGAFRLTLTSRPVNDEPAADCRAAEVLCSATADPAPVAELRGVGAVPNESFRDACLDGREANTYWYKWRVATAGELAFALTPDVVADDLDFALYRVPDLQSCDPKELVACGTGRAPAAAGGQTGLRAGGGADFGPPVDAAAGEVYALLVNASGASSGRGFRLSLAGTTATFGRADPAFDVTVLDNACGRLRYRVEPTGAPFADVDGVSYGWSLGTGPDAPTRAGRRVQVFATTAGGPLPLALEVTTPYAGCDDRLEVTVDEDLVEGGVQIGEPLVEQPACGAGATPTGTVTFAGPPPGDGYVYSYRRDGGTPEGVGADSVFAGLPPGEYVFAVNPLDGCTSREYGPYTLAVPDGAVATRAGDLRVDAPTCDVPTGTLTVTDTVDGAGARTYAVDDGAPQASPVFAGLAPGPHFVDIDEVGLCGVRLEFTVGEVPAAPELGEAVVGAASCEVARDGTVEVVVARSPPGERLFSLDDGTPQTSPTFGGLAPGRYTARVTAGGSCPTAQGLLVPVGAPAPLDEPVVATPTCAGSLGGQIAPGPGDAPGTAYSLDGIDYTGGPVFGDLEAGVYTLYGRSPDGCVATARAEVPPGPPLALAAEGVAPGCAGARDGRIDVADAGRSFEYALGDGAYGPERAFRDLAAGTYVVRARDTAPPFCEGVAEVTIPVPGPDATRLDLGAPVDVPYNTPYVVDGAVATGLGTDFAYAYGGVEGATCRDVDCQVIEVTPLETTAVAVSATGPAGCTFTGELTLRVAVDAGVFAPTAFSPNGDGDNDEWRPRLTPAVGRVFAVRVYDRLGALVWQALDPAVDNGPLPGWRGTVGDDDEEAPSGVYVAVVEAEVAGLRRVVAADVTLVR